MAAAARPEHPGAGGAARVSGIPPITLEATLDTQDVPEKVPSLSELGYKITDGVVGRLDGKEVGRLSQAKYDELGDAVTVEIQRLMVVEQDMRPLWLSVFEGTPRALDTPDGKTPAVRVFATSDVYTNTERLMVLIQGLGAVRPGQWARSVCINDCLQDGAMLTYIARARRTGYAVLVLNPNVPSVGRARRVIPGSSDRREHSVTAWDAIVRRSPAAKIAVVAHSAGGASIGGLVRDREAEVLKRVQAVALTDAMHDVYESDTPGMITFFRDRCVDWRASRKPVDSPMRGSDVIQVRSAGDTRHVYTTARCEEPLFKFFASKLGPRPKAPAAGAAAGAAAAGAAASAGETTAVAAAAAASAEAGASSTAAGDEAGEVGGEAKRARVDAPRDAVSSSGAGAGASTHAGESKSDDAGSKADA